MMQTLADEQVVSGSVGETIQRGPFGTFGIARSQDSLRNRAAGLPVSRAGASITRRLMALRGRAAYDVEVFPTINVRLYPTTNICEKRVLAAAHFLDAQERAFLDSAVASSTSKPFVFLDLGANVGLYGLSVLSCARRLKRDIKVMSVERDPTTRSRLTENIKFSNASDKFIVESCGVGSARGTGGMVGHADNRGQHRVITDTTGALGAIEIVPLLDLCQRHSITSIDAVKIDVEGMDFEVLSSFFASAPRSLYPRAIIVEVPDGANPPVVALCEKYGYRIVKLTALNAILTCAEAPNGNC